MAALLTPRPGTAPWWWLATSDREEWGNQATLTVSIWFKLKGNQLLSR